MKCYALKELHGCPDCGNSRLIVKRTVESYRNEEPELVCLDCKKTIGLLIANSKEVR